MSQTYLNFIKPIVINLWRTHQILPSIAASQAILESGWGSSKLSKPPYNNHHGIKAGAGYTGRKVSMGTLEDDGSGNYYGVNAYFRAYDHPRESFEDYANNFTATPWLTNLYKGVVGGTNYRTVANLLQGTYATDTRYAGKLINLIETYGLTQWDSQAMGDEIQNKPLLDETENKKDPTTAEQLIGQSTSDRVKVERLEYSDQKFSKPSGKNYILNEKLNEQFGFKANKGEPLWIEHFLEVDSDDPEEILRQGLEYMEQHSKPEAQYTVSVKTIPQDLTIGSTGYFIDHEFNPPLYIKARVLSIQQSFSDPTKNQVTIGNVEEIVPQDKAQIYAIQDQLKKVRDNLVATYTNSLEYQFSVQSTQGVVLTRRKQGERNLIKQPMKWMKLEPRQDYLIDIEQPEDPKSILRFSGKVVNNIEKVVQDRPFIAPLGWLDPKTDETYHDKGKTNPQGATTRPNSESVQTERLKQADFYALPVYQGEFAGNDEQECIVTLYSDSTFDVPLNVKKNSNGNYQAIDGVNLYFEYGEQFEIQDLKVYEPLKGSKANTTELQLKVTQGDIDVIDRFPYFVWTRVSDNPLKDIEWNDSRKFYNRSVINISANDILAEESYFICTVFDYKSNRVGAGGFLLKADNGSKSAYDLAVENGFKGTEKEWLISLKGEDGKDGIAGKAGVDGRTPYTHIAYANSADGSVEFSTSDPRGRAYMGIYTDYTSADSQDYTQYKWILVKGEKGDRGAQGAKGESGDQSKNYFIAHNLRDIATETTVGGVKYKSVKITVPKNEGLIVTGTLDKDKKEVFLTHLNNGIHQGRWLSTSSSTGTFTFLYREDIEDKLMAMETEYRVHIHKYTSSRLPWEPSTEDAIYINTRDMRNELANKANASLTQEQLNKLKAQAEVLLQEQQALASKREMNDFMKAFNSFLSAQEQDKAEAEKNLSSALSRVAEIENDLGEMAVSFKFLTKEITASEEGLVIGNKSKGTYLLQSDDRISFFNNGSEVAFISGGMLRITRAVFLREIVIGAFSISEYENDHLTYRYVGRR